MSTTRVIRLQSVGWVPAVEAHELRVGDTLMWNFGSTAEVLAIKEVSTQFLLVTSKSAHNGKTYDRRMKRTRLVARVPQHMLPKSPKN